jgi:hypothetical protein
VFQKLVFAALMGSSGLVWCGAPAVPGPGLAYTNDWVRRVPWSIHVLQIDRSRRDFEWVTTFGQNHTLGVAPLTDHVRALAKEGARPIAALNGDFFSEHEPFVGDPRGLQIARGELVSAPDGRACFWIDAEGRPHVAEVMSRLRVIWPTGEVIPCGLNEGRSEDSAVLYSSRVGTSTRTVDGREFLLGRAGTNEWLPLQAGRSYSAQVKQVRDGGNLRVPEDSLVLSLGPALADRLATLRPGSRLEVSTATAPSLTGAQLALGGGPVLVHGGTAQPARAFKSTQRHPRAAIGWSSRHFYLVAVDGRQPGLSVGMTLPEFASYLVKLGCDEAMNLDGGWSVELWVNGQIVNSPCYGHERRTGNALVLLQTAPPKAP